MKKAVLLIGLLGVMASAQASATIYMAHCQSCTGGPAGGASWLAAAVNLAQANNAQEDDLLWICKNTSATNSMIAEYIVNHDPVANSGDIAWTFTQGYIGATCADLGF